MLLVAGCQSIQPRPIEKPVSVEHSYSIDQPRSVDGVELLVQDARLNGVLAVSDVALVRGNYVYQFRTRLSNTGGDTIQVRTEPVWFDQHGVQLDSMYSQQQVHRLRGGQGISITHNAASQRARTVRLIVDCPANGCRVEE